MEFIKAAAIKRSDGVISIGKHHAEIIKNSPFGTCKAGSEQGFILEDGSFVNRKTAALIAFNAGQIKSYEKGDYLISEEIWFWGDYEYDKDKGYYLPENKKIGYKNE